MRAPVLRPGWRAAVRVAVVVAGGTTSMAVAHAAGTAGAPARGAGPTAGLFAAAAVVEGIRAPGVAVAGAPGIAVPGAAVVDADGVPGVVGVAANATGATHGAIAGADTGMTDAAGAAGDDGSAAADVERLLAEIGEAQGAVTTFRARFEQEKRLEIVRDVLRSSGTILVSRDRGVVWEIESPEPARMAVLDDGVFVDGRALGEMPGGGGPLPAGRLGAIFAGVSPKLLEDFEVTSAAGGALRLKPRHAALAAVVREITLDLDGPHRLPARITLDEDGGATTVIRLDRFEVDPEIPEGAFSP